MTPNTPSPHALTLSRLVFFAFALALMQNLLPPNGFSATVLQFDYSFGFIRRGLVGALANFYWGESVSKSEIYIVSLLMTLFGLGVIFALAKRFFVGPTSAFLLAILLFTSFMFRAIIGTTGYLDLVLIGMVGLGFLSDPTTTRGLIIRCTIAIFGMFVHEIMLAYFAVFQALDIWIGRKSTPLLRRAFVSLLPFFCGVLAFLTLAIWGEMPASDIADFLAYIHAKAEFKLDVTATVVMERTLWDNLAVMTEKRTEMGYRAWIILDGLPLLAMSIWVGWLNLKLLAPARGHLTRLLIICAILAPLSLNIIAFDIVRFGAMSVFIGFLTIASQMRADPGTYNRLETVLTWPHFTAVLMINMYVTVTQLNIGEANVYALPWVLLKQLQWVN